MTPKGQDDFFTYCASLGWDFVNVAPWDQVGYQPALPYAGPQDACSSIINVEDYGISDFEFIPVVAPSPPEVVLDSRGKGKWYTLEETIVVAHCYVYVSKETMGGHQPKVCQFWTNIAARYNQMKPRWACEREWDHLHKHWDRVAVEVTKYANIFHKMWASGHSWDDIRRKALKTFLDEEKKEFKFEKIFDIVKEHPKFAGGTESGGGPKRTKTTASGNYTTNYFNSPMENSFGTHVPSYMYSMSHKATNRRVVRSSQLKLT